jgi:hypothetical protein
VTLRIAFLDSGRRDRGSCFTAGLLADLTGDFWRLSWLPDFWLLGCILPDRRFFACLLGGFSAFRCGSGAGYSIPAQQGADKQAAL